MKQTLGREGRPREKSKIVVNVREGTEHCVLFCFDLILISLSSHSFPNKIKLRIDRISIKYIEIINVSFVLH